MSYLFPCLSLLDPRYSRFLAFVVVKMEEASDENLPLDAERRNQKVEGHRG